MDLSVTTVKSNMDAQTAAAPWATPGITAICGMTPDAAPTVFMIRP